MAEAFPVAQRDGILTEHIDGELVVVDSRTQQAHALPALAAAVWSLCDGNHGVAAIAARTGASPDQVTDVLAQLSDLDLLEIADPDHTVDRRAMLGRTAKLGGAAALAAPILTVALPAAAAHASGTGASYTIKNVQYLLASENNPAIFEYSVSPPADGSVQPFYDSETGISKSVYAGSTSPASYARPSGEPYVIVVPKSDGSLLLTLVQYDNGGSATYTDPDGTSGSVPPTGSTDINGFSTGSATLVVSAT